MKTKEEVEQAFRADLQELLNKYGAEIESTDCGVYRHSVLTVYIEGKYSPDGECIIAYTDFELGTRVMHD